MKKLILSFCLFIFTLSLFATDVSGNQSGTWDLAGSPYNIIGEITVPANQTLQIDSGIEVIAMGNYRITALGNIVAVGTIGDTIHFYGNGGLNWGGIRLEDEIVESTFDYCRISNTDDLNDYGIHSINSLVSIDHSYIDDHQKGVSFSGLSSNSPSYMEIKNSKVAYIQKSGITIVDNSNVLIDNCEVTRCALGTSFYGAIQLSLQNNSHSCSPTITNNYIHHNDKQGITLANMSGFDDIAPLVKDNEVCFNYTGIYLYGGQGTYNRNHIHHNFVENNANSGAGVMLEGSSAYGVFTYNEIHHNYTGFFLVANATVNLGDLNNTDPDDDGYNCIYDNIFFTGEEFSVYNTSSADVTAENTVWDDDPPIDVTIIDGNDVGSYGIVDYEPTLTPYAPPSDFSITVEGNNVMVSMPTGILYPTYLYPESWNLYQDGVMIANSITSSFYVIPMPLIPGQTYIFGVSIIYDEGYESVVTEKTITIPLLNPPQNPEIVIDNPNVIFTWDDPIPGSTSPPDPLAHFNVFLDGVLEVSTNDNQWIFSDLIVGQEYTAGVCANYEAGASEIIEIPFTYSGYFHDPPLNAGYEIFPDHIHLYWEEPNPYVEEYHIYVDGVLYTTTDLFFDIYDLTPGQEYEIGLTALYIDGIESDPITFNILFVGSGDILNLETKLIGNHPNPFNPSTTISFSLNPEDSQNAKLEIYNLKGQRIKQFSIFNAQSSVIWDGTDETDKSVSSGVYFYKLLAGDKIFTRKMLMMK